ncbi:DUF885 domain-containing protein [Kordiimonas pumila]|uniref:DUF885 domain-containing protein n=2 Tax=Kordiimonas pumila TaxID=2161677 RepID=A0ABV7D3D8_9PROT
MASMPQVMSAQDCSDQGQELTKIFDALYADLTQLDPEMASVRGEDANGLRGKLKDRSLKGRDIFRKVLLKHIGALRNINPLLLSDDQKLQQKRALDWLTHQEKARRAYDYGDEYFYAYQVTQFTGAYITVPALLNSVQRVTSDGDVDHYLDRLRYFGDAVEAEIANQIYYQKIGVTAPRFIVQKVVSGLSSSSDPDAAFSNLVKPLLQKASMAGVDPREEEAKNIVVHNVLPALRKQKKLYEKLLQSARGGAGVWALPGGEGFYRDALYYATTSNSSPEEMHLLGLRKVEEINRRLDRLLKDQGMSYGTCAQRLEALKQEPSQYFSDDDQGREELLGYLEKDIERTSSQLSGAFSNLPPVKLDVKRMPAFLEGKGPSAMYMAASADLSRRAAIVFDLGDMAKWPIFSLKTLCRHEGMPGHHLQALILGQSTSLPKVLSLFNSPSYSEGWALYAEQLTQELGLYDDDPMSEIGLWQSLLFRAARIVVDTGIHFKRWSRAKAIAYMRDITALPLTMIETEVDRYTVIPGQACAYMMGQIEWHSIRNAQQKKYGDAFELAKFHSVLSKGAMPMSLLRQYIDENL